MTAPYERPHGVRRHRDGCRCTVCRAAVAAQRKHHRELAAAGTPASAAAAPVRAHVQRLLSSGLTTARIAELAAVSHGVVAKLLWGEPSRGRPPQRWLRAGNASALLAVRPTLDATRGRHMLDGTGTCRRLQALMWRGWSLSLIAGHVGVDRAALSVVLADGRASARMIRAVDVAYGQMWDQEPPAATPTQRGTVTRTRRLARRSGWVSPLAWDDDTIDDPAATPDHGRPDIGTGGRRADLAAVEVLLARGDTHAAIAERFAVSVRTVERYAAVLRRTPKDPRRTPRLSDEQRAGVAVDAADLKECA